MFFTGFLRIFSFRLVAVDYCNLQNSNTKLYHRSGTDKKVVSKNGNKEQTTNNNKETRCQKLRLKILKHKEWNDDIKNNDDYSTFYQQLCAV
jgi:hypothetical protein